MYFILGIYQRGDCAAKICILEYESGIQYKYGTCGMQSLRMYYQYTVIPWKINVKMLIHINTNIIYNIVSLEFFFLAFRMSAMHFAFYTAKMTHIDNYSISILRQSHYWYTMRLWFFFIKMSIHLEKTMMNNIVYLECIKKEIVRPINAF